MPPSVVPEGFDVTDPDRIKTEVPFEQLAALRAAAPVWWNAQPRRIGGFDDEGFWLVTRHADVKEVSLKPEIYSSWANTAIVRFDPGITRDEIEMQRLIMLNADPPDHTKLRRIVSRGFTPMAIRKISDALAARAERIVHEAKEKGEGDFVTMVASELPLQAIAELIGVPQEDRSRIFTWSNQMIGYDDPEYDIDPMVASAELINYAMEMGSDRERNPREDVVTKLMQADVDGRGLTPDEFAFFVLLLAVAGNETTRNAITHGMMGFFQFPDQWELYRSERPETTADEVVRWATPVMTFQRTAMTDTVLGGVDIKAGQRVGMCYSSANFDTDVFEHPERFDVTRAPNPHVGFGGGGPHYCLGANLAKLEINLIFNAVAEHMPNIRPAGTARRLRSAWINGIKELPVSFR
ncbi:cytochrome P450 [Acidiferrimicrobium sp. IK]|uniref:cytochrome P450 n=1 Tax=Acidiferrimicrobium sp. IK TaxID=2871700 RepID=UPI0021CB1C1B|nr:cytochrome P450 [Acidiferrimicrobium sp. IK]MCU4184213.1 cytochrome P450 [Acidiferrimicrobium sp. IK]